MIVRPKGYVRLVARITKRERTLDVELPRATNETGAMPKVVVRLDEEQARELYRSLAWHVVEAFGYFSVVSTAEPARRKGRRR